MARAHRHPDTLGYQKKLAARVKELAPTRTVKDIFAVLQAEFPDKAPKSLSTFYKYYRADMDTAKGVVAQRIGDKIIKTALEGDEDSPFTHKSREFYMDRVGGWAKKEVLETREIGSEEEENESAVEALMAALGKKTTSASE